MVYIANGNPEVNNFRYTEENLNDFEASLSQERLGTYLDSTDGDREEAVQLHVWNTAVGSAFFGPLQILEVTLRNSMNRRLSETYGEAWYDNCETGLNRRAQDLISRVRYKLDNVGHGDVPHRIVAALSFGFWVSLLNTGHPRGNYEMTLWRPALRKSFPHCDRLRRSQAFEPLNRLLKLRNRIAHHEPIFLRNLNEEHNLILEITGWISPTTQEWIEYHSRVPELLHSSRDAGAIRF